MWEYFELFHLVICFEMIHTQSQQFATSGKELILNRDFTARFSSISSGKEQCVVFSTNKGTLEVLHNNLLFMFMFIYTLIYTLSLTNFQIIVDE